MPVKSIALLFYLIFFRNALAAVIEVSPSEKSLDQAIAVAAAGDVLSLAPGIYSGNFRIDKPLTLEGPPLSQGLPTAILEGPGTGSVITVTASGVTIRRLLVRGSGTSAQGIDSGILLLQGAEGVRVEDNRVEGNLFGIAVQGAPRTLVRKNHIRNRNDLWLNDRGNGINIWNTTGSLIEENDVAGGRDGLFITTASGNTIRANHFHDLRFAIHYMYANRNLVMDNLSEGNEVGYALMYSNDIKVTGNVSRNDRDHGLMVHTSHRAKVNRNLVKGSTGDGMFVYTSAHGSFHDNRLEDCTLGIHFSGGSERNEIYGNAFINNRTQVKFPGTVWYEWSHQGRGNYWSDNPAFDLNGDGLADVAYRPNSVVDRVVWNYPLAKLLLSSPVMEVLRFAQKQFPAIYPGGVIDSWPLATPPELDSGG